MIHIPMVSLRIVRERSVQYPIRKLVNAQAAYDLFRGIGEDLDREAMWVACLDSKNRVLCLSQVALGALNQMCTEPREVLKVAVVSNAASFITVHNHPSGDPDPSQEDRCITVRLKEASQVLGIKLLDHLIVGDGRFYSFAEENGW